MELRPLGSTGLQVSVLGLGTVKLGRNTGVKYPGGEGFPLPTDAQATDLLRTAADLGINLIDTAPAYGTSEERLGTLMAANNWFGGRDRWVICTKAGEEFDPATSTSRYDFSPASIRASVERSLSRLRIDHLDAVLLHSDQRDEWVVCESGALGALAELKAVGKVRAIGVSVKSVRGGIAALSHGSDILMVTYNPDDRVMEHVMDLGASRPRGKCGFMVKKALASGHTTDPASALRFALACPGVSCVVVGTTSPAHLRANAAALTPVQP